jgi:hypothetical protein
MNSERFMEERAEKDLQWSVGKIARARRMDISNALAEFDAKKTLSPPAAPAPVVITRNPEVVSTTIPEQAVVVLLDDLVDHQQRPPSPVVEGPPSLSFEEILFNHPPVEKLLEIVQSHQKLNHAAALRHANMACFEKTHLSPKDVELLDNGIRRTLSESQRLKVETVCLREHVMKKLIQKQELRALLYDVDAVELTNDISVLNQIIASFDTLKC